MGAAKSANYLRKRGVTHVLNSAEGTRIGTVNASQECNSIDIWKLQCKLGTSLGRNLVLGDHKFRHVSKLDLGQVWIPKMLLNRTPGILRPVRDQVQGAEAPRHAAVQHLGAL